MPVRDIPLQWRDYEYNTQLRLNKIRYFTASVDPGSITTATSAEVAVTIRGVKLGDIVFAAPPASLDTKLAYSGCRVSAADTVQVRLTSTATVDDTARTWEFLVFALDAGQ